MADMGTGVGTGMGVMAWTGVGAGTCTGTCVGGDGLGSFFRGLFTARGDGFGGVETCAAGEMASLLILGDG
jgi:hypothetical protein